MFFMNNANKVYVYSLTIPHCLLWLELALLCLFQIVSTTATFSCSFLIFLPSKRKLKGKRPGKDQGREKKKKYPLFCFICSNTFSCFLQHLEDFLPLFFLIETTDKNNLKVANVTSGLSGRTVYTAFAPQALLWRLAEIGVAHPQMP